MPQGSEPERAGGHPRVVIIGGGFAGLAAAKALKKAPVRITLIDRQNHHLFQPLLYQVATATLSPADIAQPLRKILSSQRNARVVLAEAERIDTESRCVGAGGRSYRYDYLIVAAGARHSYFGHEEWEALAPGLKSIEDALEIRRRFLSAFERAEVEDDPAEREALLTFLVVGGGPTGVEMAGAIAEISRKTMIHDFRAIDIRSANVVLVEGGDRLLPAYPEASSADAKRQLENLGVRVVLVTYITAMDERGAQGGDERFEARNVIWAAGVKGSALAEQLPGERTRDGRVRVEPDLSVPSLPRVFVCGDLACAKDGGRHDEVPGVAPAAMQMGRFVGKLITGEARASASGSTPPERPAFRYLDKGSLATIGRARAVAVVAGRRFSGLLAWLLWVFVHILFLVSFRSRLMVMLSWVWTYFFYDRGARLITEAPRGPYEGSPTRSSSS